MMAESIGAVAFGPARSIPDSEKIALILPSFFSCVPFTEELVARTAATTVAFHNLTVHHNQVGAIVPRNNQHLRHDVSTPLSRYESFEWHFPLSAYDQIS